MSNSQTKLLSLAIIAGCGVVAFGCARGDTMPILAFVALAALVVFIFEYKDMKS